MIKILIFAVIVASRSFAANPELDELWNKYKKYYNKNYGDDEESKRKIWEEKISLITNHNLNADLKVNAYRLGINEYMDNSNEDFIKLLTGYKSDSAQSTNGMKITKWVESAGVETPETLDWRAEGLVSKVKNQRLCASSWAFSATGAIEAQNKLKNGKMVSLSEQNLIDCSSPQGNQGCDGGNMNNAFEYVMSNNGIDTDDFYSYKAKTGESCGFNTGAIGTKITGYFKLANVNEEDLKIAVSVVGPVSAAIDASQLSFQLYKTGIYYEPKCSNKDLNHAILIIGYGTENGEDYWLVKNSWGRSWGMEGYVKMARNKNNNCGIASQVSYPVV